MLLELVLNFMVVWLSLVNCNPSKPNFVILYIEQINDILPDLLSPTLGEELKNLNILRKESVTFHNVYGEVSSTSTFAALFTGRPAVDLGLVRGKVLPFTSFPSLASSGGLSTSEKNIAKELKKQNYKTWFTGFWKMGLGPKGLNFPTEHGFMTWLGVAYQHNEWCERHKSAITNQQSFLYHPYMKLFYRTSFLWLLLFLFMTVLSWFKFISFQLYINLLVYTISTGFAFYILLHLFIIQRSASCVLYYNDQVLKQPYDTTNITLQFTQHSSRLIEGAAETGKEPFFMMLNYLKMLPPYIHSSYFDKARSHTRHNSLLELDWSVGFLINKLKEYNLYDNTVVIVTGGNTCSHSNRKELYKVYQRTSSSAEEILSKVSWDECFRTTLWIKDIAAEKTSISDVRDIVPVTGIFHTILHMAINPEQSIDDSFLRFFRYGTCPTKPFLELSSEAINTFADGNRVDNRSIEDLMFNQLFLEEREEKKKKSTNFLFHYFNVQRPVMVTYKGEFHIIFYYLDSYNSLQKLNKPLIIDLKNSLRTFKNESERTMKLETIHSEVMKELKLHMQERQHLNLWTSQFEMPVLPWLLPCENFPYCRTRHHYEDDNFFYLFLNKSL